MKITVHITEMGIYYCKLNTAAGLRSKGWVCGRSPAEIVGSNPAEGVGVCLL